MVVKGKGKNLIGDAIYIHKDFAPTLKKIDDIAKQCMVKLSVRGSYDQLGDISKVSRLTTAHSGHHLTFIVMDQTGKKLVCNNVCLSSKYYSILWPSFSEPNVIFRFLEEGEKVPEVKCLATHFRRENLRFGPHGEVGAVDDASDAKPGFTDVARKVQEACKGVKI